MKPRQEAASSPAPAQCASLHEQQLSQFPSAWRRRRRSAAGPPPRMQRFSVSPALALFCCLKASCFRASLIVTRRGRPVAGGTLAGSKRARGFYKRAAVRKRPSRSRASQHRRKHAAMDVFDDRPSSSARCATSGRSARFVDDKENVCPVTGLKPLAQKAASPLTPGAMAALTRAVEHELTLPKGKLPFSHPLSTCVLSIRRRMRSKYGTHLRRRDQVEAQRAP